MEVGGQRQTPVAVPPGKTPGTRCAGGSMGFRTGFDVCGKSRPHRDSIFRPSSYTDYSILVHHVRLSFCIIQYVSETRYQFYTSFKNWHSVLTLQIFVRLRFSVSFIPSKPSLLETLIVTLKRSKNLWKLCKKKSLTFDFVISILKDSSRPFNFL